jgi:hypothetical protein
VLALPPELVLPPALEFPLALPFVLPFVLPFALVLPLRQASLQASNACLQVAWLELAACLHCWYRSVQFFWHSPRSSCAAAQGEKNSMKVGIAKQTMATER